MIVRHSETRSHEPSVRFYRTIAFSFLIITVLLLGVVVFITSKKATITIISKEDSKSINLSVGVDALGGTEKIKGRVTSTVFVWSEKYFPTGAKTTVGVAEGEVIIYNKGNTDQVLIKTTRLLNPDNVLFRLTDRVLVPANGQVTAKVYADKAGSESEIGPSQFVIPGLNAEKQKIIYAESKTKMVGGVRSVGFLSENDLKNAKDDYAEKVKKAVVESLNVDEWAGLGKLAVVVSQDVVSDKQIGQEIDGFVLSGTSTATIVGYDQIALTNLVSSEMSKKIDVGSEQVLSATGNPTPSVLSYDINNGSAQLSVRQEILVTLDPDAEALAPRNFVGKNKDEIERYILGVDHVASASVKFTPSWVRKAPSAADRIKIIVKNVK